MSFDGLWRLALAHREQPQNPNLCLGALAEQLRQLPQIEPSQADRNRVVLRMRDIFHAVGATTEADQQALNALAVYLMGDGQADLTRLNEWCARFQNDPQALERIFNQFHDLLERFGISSQVVSVPEVEEVEIGRVYMDIAIPGTNHALRLSSSPTECGQMVTTSTIINAAGDRQEIQHVIPGNSATGAMRAIQRALIRALPRGDTNSGSRR